MARGPIRRAAALALLACLASCGGGSAGKRPNLLFVSIDSLRADALNSYGAEWPHAPGASSSAHLDALAASGVRVEGACATTSWTLPSHLSMFTGCTELVHGVDLDGDRLREDLVPLAGALQLQGYRTAGFYSGPYLDPRFGHARGFERYERCYGTDLEIVSRALDQAADEAGFGSQPFSHSREVDFESHRDVSSKHVVDAALEELDRAAEDGRPFFLFAHLFDVHYDYLPPKQFSELLDPDYAGNLDASEFLTNPALSLPVPGTFGGRRRVLSDRDFEHLQALYGGELAWVDSQLGRIFDRLEELGVADETLVVVTSDHGEEFFENGGLGHRRTLRREVIDVPLLLRLPGVLPAGKTVRGPVSLAALMPTVLELLGVEVPGTVTRRSFAPLLRGETDSAEQGVLGRLVTLAHAEERIGSGVLPTTRIELRETFLKGSLKIVRSRAWPEARDALTAEMRAQFRQSQERSYAIEDLRWTDLASNPRDRSAGYSTDFSAAPARTALLAFRAEYAELVAARRAGAGGTDTATLQRELEALGYVVPPGFRIERQEWLVPPPPGGEADL